MKTTLLLATLAAGLLTATPARAGGPSETPNLLLVNAGDLFNGVLSVEYERALSSWFGLTAGLSVSAFRGPFVFPGNPAVGTFGPELGARFHFIRAAPGGLWLGPYLTLGYVFARSDGSISQAFAWGLGAAVGYNFIIGRHFTLQLGAGGGFNDYGDRIVWAPRLRLGLGVAF